MSDNTELWDRLGKTDPKHTKKFTRAGGFSGTAIKPMWAIKRMTEEFGPCGEGWGTYDPQFQVVPVGDETLVFCTVGMWHKDSKNIVYGVGGDKCLAKRNNGNSFADDEAFKKAYTDALTNAMKLIGVGADVHMGLFDDNKYVAEMNREYSDTGQISGETVDMERVGKAINYFKNQIDEDDPDHAPANIKKAWERLNNDERVKVQEGLGDKAPGTNRMYKTLLKDYLNHQEQAA